MASYPEFGAHTEASTVAAAFASSIRDKVILITGVTSGGIGGATAKALAAHSPQLLILAGRSPDRVNPVITDIAAANPTVRCRFLSIDLSSQVSVRAAAKEVLAYKEPLHIMINNAGVMNLPTRILTTEGLEMQFAINHIGPFLLTNLLLRKMVSVAQSSSAGSVRIINLSSTAHIFSPIRFSDLNFSQPDGAIPQEERFLAPALDHLGVLVYDGHYVPSAAYAQSKTANNLFTIALNARLAEKKGIRSFAVHPGSVESELQRYSDKAQLAEARERFGSKLVRKTLEEGASTTLVAALDPGLVAKDGGAGYMSDCGFAEPAEWCREEKGKAMSERLWQVSETIVGQKFGW